MSAIKCFLESDFAATVKETCEDNTLTEYLDQVKNVQVVKGIEYRLKRPSKYELKLYVDEKFVLPLGLKRKLANALFDHAIILTCNESYDVFDSRYTAVSKRLIRCWRKGLISPSELFQQIDSSAMMGLVTAEEAQLLTEDVLTEGGYVPHPPSNTEISPTATANHPSFHPPSLPALTNGCTTTATTLEHGDGDVKKVEGGMERDHKVHENGLDPSHPEEDPPSDGKASTTPHTAQTQIASPLSKRCVHEIVGIGDLCDVLSASPCTKHTHECIIRTSRGTAVVHTTNEAVGVSSLLTPNSYALSTGGQEVWWVDAPDGFSEHPAGPSTNDTHPHTPSTPATAAGCCCAECVAGGKGVCISAPMINDPYGTLLTTSTPLANELRQEFTGLTLMRIPLEPKPLLCIGDTLTCTYECNMNGDMGLGFTSVQVDHTIGVSSRLSDGILELVILVEGRWTCSDDSLLRTPYSHTHEVNHSNSPDADVSRKYPVESDLRSEVAVDDYNHITDETSSMGSEGPVSPGVLYKTRYFIGRSTVCCGECVMHQLCEIEGIKQDQQPTTVVGQWQLQVPLPLPPHTCTQVFVSGAGGLLGTCSFQQTSQHKIRLTQLCTDVLTHCGAATAGARRNDTHAHTQAQPTSHLANSVVNVLSLSSPLELPHSPATCRQQYLVSCDHTGGLCVWLCTSYISGMEIGATDSAMGLSTSSSLSSVLPFTVEVDMPHIPTLQSQPNNANPLVHTISLHGEPLLLKQRIYRVTISPQGTGIIVSLMDRVMLINVSQPAIGHPQQAKAASLMPTMYIRCMLDVVDGFRAQYVTSFENEYIHVWRVMTCGAQSPAVNGEDINASGMDIVNNSNTTTIDNDNMTSQPPIAVDVDQLTMRITHWLHPNIEFPENQCNCVPINTDNSNNGVEDSSSRLGIGSPNSKCGGLELLRNRLRSSTSTSGAPAVVCAASTVGTVVAEDCNGSSIVSSVSVKQRHLNQQFRPSATHAITSSSSSPVGVPLPTTFTQNSDSVNRFQCPIICRSRNVLNVAASGHGNDCPDSAGLKRDHCGTPTQHTYTSSQPSSMASLPSCMLPVGSHTYPRYLYEAYGSDSSPSFTLIRRVLEVFCAGIETVSLGLLTTALDEEPYRMQSLIQHELSPLLVLDSVNDTVTAKYPSLCKWLCSKHPSRSGCEYWIDIHNGHNILTGVYLRYCANKSIAIEHPWQDYLKVFGPVHLRRSSRGLRLVTSDIRKIDETANIRGIIPIQLGYVTGLQELYARRVGLVGELPAELGELRQLRVLSMGNNRICGSLPPSLGRLTNLQRIVLHQNKLSGTVPPALGRLGCIVNLAGNPMLKHGDDVPQEERNALGALFGSTKGIHWMNKSGWVDPNVPVCKWYKVGVLSSHVHSIVMSSNNMDGKLPSCISTLTRLRMIELATMPSLSGTLTPELCSLTSLRRLCICRCGLRGKLPVEIGHMVELEELQLFGNSFTGTLPSTISKLTSLRLLSLGEYTGGNNFTAAPLSSSLSCLKKLEALFMANCNVTGSLPSWIGCLTELRQLDIQRNSLSGSLPSEISRCGQLLYLNVKDNSHLGGQIPIASLGQLNKLNRLSLVHCNFSNANEASDQLQVHLPRCKIWV